MSNKQWHPAFVAAIRFAPAKTAHIFLLGGEGYEGFKAAAPPELYCLLPLVDRARRQRGAEVLRGLGHLR
ncbi:MAG: hypothetical protein D9V47_14895 [Clostridia bacterium]|nr:MAG: hypothetical protein D9V47_14895 [Clostridia bacterium]